MRSWFNGRTGPCQGSDSGPIPGGRTKNSMSFINSYQSLLNNDLVRNVDNYVDNVYKGHITKLSFTIILLKIR